VPEDTRRLTRSVQGSTIAISHKQRILCIQKLTLSLEYFCRPRHSFDLLQARRDMKILVHRYGSRLPDGYLWLTLLLPKAGDPVDEHSLLLELASATSQNG
jgi:hypothetical protein